MEKDERYKIARRAIEKKQVRQFKELFKYIPKAVVAADLAISPGRFAERSNQVGKFNLKDMFRLSELIGVDSMKILGLVGKQYEIDSDGKTGT